MNTKGVNFQPSKRGQFSAAVDTRDGKGDLLAEFRQTQHRRPISWFAKTMS